jgi:hypothetical protein
MERLSAAAAASIPRQMVGQVSKIKSFLLKGRVIGKGRMHLAPRFLA